MENFFPLCETGIIPESHAAITSRIWTYTASLPISTFGKSILHPRPVDSGREKKKSGLNHQYAEPEIVGVMGQDGDQIAEHRKRDECFRTAAVDRSKMELRISVGYFAPRFLHSFSGFAQNPHKGWRYGFNRLHGQEICGPGYRKIFRQELSFRRYRHLGFRLGSQKSRKEESQKR